MRKTYFTENLSLIRSVWKMQQGELADLLGMDRYNYGNLERGSKKEIPASVILDLEELTGITAKRLYYEELTKEMIYYKPLKRESTVDTLNEAPPQYLTIEERIRRLEEHCFGV